MFYTISNFLLILTATSTALISGLFFAYSFSVTAGLGKLLDAQYLAAMQSINQFIQNPVFFTAFFGAFFLLPAVTFIEFSSPITTRCLLLASACLLYWIGVMGVTVFGNVPLNENLAVFSIAGASPVEIHEHRLQFETGWNKLNLIRTIAATISLLLIVVACLHVKTETH